jgi:hypothetical protein
MILDELEDKWSVYLAADVREPREISCPAFRAIRTPPARKRAHRPHTSAVEIKIFKGFERVLLIGSLRSGLVQHGNLGLSVDSWRKLLAMTRDHALPHAGLSLQTET